jgi:2-polyprenyl-6-methoxyphenol hydroxylase-like FAD-dependent oxidoreductase
MKENSIFIVGSGAIGKALAVFLKHEDKDVLKTQLTEQQSIILHR